MAAAGTCMMACFTLVMYMLALGGSMNKSVVAWWSVFALGGLLGALLLVRSGWSERLADPSLTLFQLQWSLVCNAVAYVIAGPLRALVLPVLVIILMFGIFGYNLRQTVFRMLYTMAMYTLAVLAAAWLDNPRPTREVVAAHLVIVLLSLLAGTLMCLQVQRMRTRLRQQKIELELALAQIRDLAMRDELTGLINRRHMTELLELELRRCQRGGSLPLLAQLDIDHFKVINDRHGHAVGDLALRAFADTVLAHLRSSDVLARWGGEEFVLLLCNAEAADAAELLERVRGAVEAHALPHGAGAIRLTVSIGWTQHLRGEPLEATLERADQALYDAKRHGRNRVVRAPINAPPTPAPAAALP